MVYLLRNILIVLALVAAGANAIASPPTDEELVSLEIPSTTTTTSALASALHDACETIASHLDKLAGVKPDPRLSVVPLKAWNAARTAGNQTDLKTLTPAALASVASLGKACDAVRGDVPFDDQMLASVRELAKDPLANAALVKTVIAEATVTPQSLMDLSSFIPSGTTEQALINGLTNFIYKRAKAEAMAFVADRLKTLLCSDDRKPFFRNLCVAFEDLDATVSLSAIGSYLAEAARKDLEHLPDVVLVYALHELSGPNGCVNKAACEALMAGRLALAFYREVSVGRRPLDLVRSLYAIQFTTLQRSQAPQVIEDVTVASQLVDAITSQAGWDQLAKGGAGELPFFALSTLLSFEEIRNGTTTSCLTAAPGSTAWCLTPAMLNKGSTLLKISSFIQRVAEAHARMNAIVQALETPAQSNDQPFEETKPRAPASPAELARAASATLALTTQIAADLRPLLLGANGGDLAAATNLAEIGEAIAMGKASVTVSVTVSDLYVRLVHNRATGDVANLIAKVRRALPIVSQLAQAQSADEVEKVLEASAAPVGAYKEKAKHQAVSVNAFVGGAVGVEDVAGNWGTPFAIFAPIGVHASWPARDKKGNVGVLFSLINVGNLVSQRLDSDTENDGVTVSSEQSDDLVKVFSPGVFGTLSLYGPFDVGLGMQLVPSAREVTEDINGMPEVHNRAALQVMAFVGIDVTIFPL